MSKNQHVIEPSDDAITFLEIKFLIATQKETDNVRKADYFSSCFKQLFFTSFWPYKLHHLTIFFCFYFAKHKGHGYMTFSMAYLCIHSVLFYSSSKELKWIKCLMKFHNIAIVDGEIKIGLFFMAVTKKK